MHSTIRRRPSYFPASTGSRISNLERISSRRFETAAEAIRYALEELEPEQYVGAYLEVGATVFDSVGIRNLYARAACTRVQFVRLPDELSTLLFHRPLTRRHFRYRSRKSRPAKRSIPIRPERDAPGILSDRE